MIILQGSCEDNTVRTGRAAIWLADFIHFSWALFTDQINRNSKAQLSFFYKKITKIVDYIKLKPISATA